MNRFTIALVIIIAGLALLLANQDSGQTLGMNNDDFARLVSLLPFATLLGAGILVSRRRALSQTLRDILLWLVIILAIVAGWVYRTDLQQIGDRVLAALIPGRAVETQSMDGETAVILHKSMDGHFTADVAINGQIISMLVDTGATNVSLSWEDAERVGINPQNLEFNETVLTANGRARAAEVTLAKVELGPLVRRNVQALVATEGRLGQSLLGMSFLATLGSVRMEADELYLHD